MYQTSHTKKKKTIRVAKKKKIKKGTWMMYILQHTPTHPFPIPLTGNFAGCHQSGDPALFSAILPSPQKEKKRQDKPCLASLEKTRFFFPQRETGDSPHLTLVYTHPSPIGPLPYSPPSHVDGRTPQKKTTLRWSLPPPLSPPSPPLLPLPLFSPADRHSIFFNKTRETTNHGARQDAGPTTLDPRVDYGTLLYISLFLSNDMYPPTPSSSEVLASPTHAPEF